MNFLKKIFHKHNHILICTKEIEDVFEWDELYHVSGATAFSEGRSYYRSKRYQGIAYLKYFYCYDCGDHYIELQYPRGIIEYSRNYLISMLYSNFEKDELMQMLKDKRVRKEE